ncbi:cytochrome P450 [Paraphaeosphaeria sporulosa]|uniref:Cytochrome P450 n=1 Tax=Paraphaeosphaeria sporulosa TaxID=1460663 RepID=A0A177CBK9_9PLEO|nr:cytochrome P450 [Paraphaeosphaeria sporulosa]OAG04252.1 cytochrome P450 [Paraphaeosphaeria sporulosa]
MQSIYILVGTLLACHGLYLFIKRRIRARNLPPKYWTIDPFMNFDWIFSTALNANMQLTLFRKYGHTYRLSKLTDPMATIITCHPENAYTILVGQDWGVEFRKAGMGQMLGSGFICTDGSEWKRSRKMIRPAFNRPNIDNFDVLEGVADKIIADIQTSDGKVEMGSLMYNALMHSSMQFILGLDSTGSNDGRPMDVQTFNKLWQEGLLGMGIRLLLGEGFSRTFLPKARYQDVCNRIHGFIDFAIDEREKKGLDSTKKTKTMAEIVTPQAKDRADARSQLAQTMLASQDTTGVLTCNVIHILSSHPNVWAQLRKEVSSAGPELLTWEGLRSNTTIQNILFETLRLRPVFPQTGRFAVRDTVLPSGGGPNHDQPLPVPAGTFAISNSWGVHVSKEIYGPDADEWKPSRWNKFKPGSKEFLAFGAGPRSCLGKDKALAEAAYLLARLVKRFESLESRTPEWKPDASFSMKNKKGYRITFKV